MNVNALASAAAAPAHPAHNAVVFAPSSYDRPAVSPAFGVGYGRSSGYVHRPSYVREWGPARFRTR